MKNNDLILPIENIDGNESSIMDGLMQEFVKTMVELGKAIAEDDKWTKDEVHWHKSDQSPVYIIRKSKDAHETIVIFWWEIYGGKIHGTIGITVDNKNDRVFMSMTGMNDVNGFSAIAADFAKIYRWHYAEVHTK